MKAKPVIRRKKLLVNCFVALGVYMLLSKFLLTDLPKKSLHVEERTNSQHSHSLLGNSEQSFMIPFLRGQGLNNQLWEYRNAAIIARASNRVLCLEPFHRFYLQKSGRIFIPFHELFDVDSLQVFVKTSENCAQLCNKRIQRHFEISTKQHSRIDPQNPFPIADWRPGSLKLFKQSTGFEVLPIPEIIDYSKKAAKFWTLADTHAIFSAYSKDKCVSVAGSTLELPEEFLHWSRALNVSKNIQNAVNHVKKYILKDKPYIAIHWRFEETKCAGFGRGIGFGRSSLKFRGTNKQVLVRKSDSDADLCFFAGPVPRGGHGIWLRLVSKKAIVQWIKLLMKEKKVENIYLATDCHDPKLLQSIKRETGAKSKSDIEHILLRFAALEENDISSRVEQQICTESYIFAGTSMSSWTSSVIEERFRDRKSFFVQDKFNMIRRPDPENRTLYFDVEVCNCE